MKKLTKTQLACIEEMKKDIDLARSCDTFTEYLLKRCFKNSRNPEEAMEKALKDHKEWYYSVYKKSYENAKNGIVLVSRYGKPTLKVLERMGIVTVVKFSGHRDTGVIDTVKLNNY